MPEPNPKAIKVRRKSEEFIAIEWHVNTDLSEFSKIKLKEVKISCGNTVDTSFYICSSSNNSTDHHILPGYWIVFNKEYSYGFKVYHPDDFKYAYVEIVGVENAGS